MQKPKSISVIINSDSIEIYWERLEGVSGYKVFKKIATGDWVDISGLIAGKSFKDIEITYNQNIFYAVKSVNGDSESELLVYEKAIFIDNSQNIVVEKPGSITFEKNEKSIKLTWDKSNNAKQYSVYRKNGNNEWESISELIVENSFTDSKIIWDEELIYGVKAELLGKFSELSILEKPIIFIPVPNEVSKINFEIGVNRVVLYWDAVDKATGYIVYRKEDDNWIACSDLIVDCKFTDVSPVYETEISYGIKTEYKGKYSNIKELESTVSITETPGVPKSLTTEEVVNGVKISWDSVGSASSYQLYIQSGQEWVKVSEEIEELSYTHLNPPFETDLLYGVVAINNGNESVLYPAINPISIIETPTSPTNIVATEGVNSIKLQWDVVDIADSYNVYFRYDNKDWELIAENVSGSIYTHIFPPYEKELIYGIQSINKDKMSVVGETGSPISIIETPTYPSNIYLEEGINSCKITWDSKENVDSYEVYIKSENNQWVSVSKVISATEFVHFNPAYETDLTYGVKSYNKSKESEIGCSSNTILIIETPTSPNNITPTGGDNRIILNWDSIEIADSYNVYLKYDNKDWELIAENVIGSTYTHFSPPYEKNLTYGIQSLNKGKLSDIGSMENTILIFETPTYPSSIDVEEGVNCCKVSWDTKESADSYEVFIKGENSKWINISGVITSNEFVHFNPPYETNLFYGVKAINNGKKSELFPTVDPISIIETPTCPVNIVTTEGVNRINIQWSSVEIADSYNIYMKYDNKDWELIEEGISSTSYIHLSPPYELDLNYGIQSVNKGKKSIVGSMGSSISIIETPSYPENINVVEGVNNCIISWDSIESADNYEVFIKDNSNQWVSISEVITVTEYIHLNPTYETDLHYGVKAINKGKESGIGSANNTISIIETPASPVNVMALEGVNSIDLTWGIVTIAESYDVYIKYDSTDWEVVQEGVIGNSYSHLNPTYEKSLTYGIIAKHKDKYSQRSEITSPISIIETPIAPNGLNITTNEDSFTFCWDSVSSARGYRIYVKHGDSGWEPVSGLITETTYIDNNVIYDKELTYGIQSVNKTKKSSIFPCSYSVMIESIGVYIKDLKVNSLQSTLGIFITWSKYKDTVKYIITRSEELNETGVVVGETTSNAYWDKPNANNNLETGKIYYYKVTWEEVDGSASGGGNITPVSGFFSNKVDTLEPDNNDMANILGNSFVLDEPLTTVLFKMGDFADRDWFKQEVPPNTTYFLSCKLLNFKNWGTVEIYRDELLLFSHNFPVMDISLSNNTNEEVTYFIKVKPNNSLSLDNFIEEYNLKITTSF